MQIETKHFGIIEVEQENILTFEEGIFGFPNDKKFTVIFDNETNNSPFCWLQSIEDSQVVLPMIDPLQIFSEYNPEIADERILKIGELKQEDLMLYTIVVVPQDIKNMTTNLKAPILLNLATKKGIQVIVENEEYKIKQNLYEQLQNLKEKGGE